MRPKSASPGGRDPSYLQSGSASISTGDCPVILASRRLDKPRGEPAIGADERSGAAGGPPLPRVVMRQRFDDIWLGRQEIIGPGATVSQYPRPHRKRHAAEAALRRQAKKRLTRPEVRHSLAPSCGGWRI